MDKSQNILKPEDWVSNYGDILFKYTVSRVFSQTAAEDIVQETFFAALKSRGRFKGDSSEKTWLFAILKNKIIDHFRKNSKESDYTSSYDLPFQREGIMLGHWDKNRAPSDWQAQIEKEEEKQLLHKIFSYCLSLLGPKLATVFSMKVVEECNTDDICKEVGITSSNYWVIMHRARLQLRECMEKNWLSN